MVSHAQANNLIVGGNHPVLKALNDLSERAPTLARAILQQSSAPGESLRATNRQLRQAVNRTVERVVLPGGGNKSALDSTADLGSIFPNATKLVLSVHSEPSRAVAASYLTHLAEVSPSLVSRLQEVDLKIYDGHVQALCLTALATFLSRCRGLETLTISICTLVDDGTRPVAFGFAGQGVTPPDRVASMQAQLAALRTTPDFLHSTNWHLLQPCLTSLIVFLPGSDQAGHASFADIVTSPLHLLQLPSLRSLEVDFATLFTPTAITEEQQALVSSLMQLTHLAGTVLDSHDCTMGSFWSHAGSLPHLQSVDVVGSPDATDTRFTIPATWSSCSSLTSLILDPFSFTAANPTCLQTLTSLQSLKLFCAATDLLHLRPLGQLTFLSVTCDELNSAEQQQGAQAQPPPHEAQVQPPASALAVTVAGAAGSWACSNALVELEWCDCHEHAPLQHLTGISRLCLTGGCPKSATPLPDSLLGPLVGLSLLRELVLEAVHLTLDLCWALGQLPKLTSLALYNVHTDPALRDVGPAAAPALLPPLAIRTLVLHGAASWSDTLNVLMRWSRLPPTATANPITIRFDQHHPETYHIRPVLCHASQCVDSGWMASLLANSDTIHPIRFRATTDRDLQLLAQHLPTCSTPATAALDLMLHGNFDPPLLGAALAAYGGQKVIVAVSRGLPEWMKTLPAQRITDTHVRAMLPALSRMASLQFCRCPLVTDAALVDVARAMGGRLERLVLNGAAKVTDTTLWALLKHCGNLRHLKLSGARHVTAAGLAPLVRFEAEGGLSVRVDGTGVDGAKLREEVERHGGLCRAGGVMVDGRDVTTR